MSQQYQKFTYSTIQRAMFWGDTVKDLIKLFEKHGIRYSATWTGFDEATMKVLKEQKRKMLHDLTK